MKVRIIPEDVDRPGTFKLPGNDADKEGFIMRCDDRAYLVLISGPGLSNVITYDYEARA